MSLKGACPCLRGKQDDNIGVCVWCSKMINNVVVCVGCNMMMLLACGLGACIAVDKGSLAEQRAWGDGVRGLGL